MILEVGNQYNITGRTKTEVWDVEIIQKMKFGYLAKNLQTGVSLTISNNDIACLGSKNEYASYSSITPILA